MEAKIKYLYNFKKGGYYMNNNNNNIIEKVVYVIFGIFISLLIVIISISPKNNNSNLGGFILLFFLLIALNAFDYFVKNGRKNIPVLNLKIKFKNGLFVKPLGVHLAVIYFLIPGVIVLVIGVLNDICNLNLDGNFFRNLYSICSNIFLLIWLVICMIKKADLDKLSKIFLIFSGLCLLCDKIPDVTFFFNTTIVSIVSIVVGIYSLKKKS